MPISFIDLVNRSLLQMGEREVPSFNSPVGRKAQYAVQTAIVFCSKLHPWLFLRQSSQVILPNWLNDRATLPGIQQMYAVYNGTTILKRQTPRNLINLALTAPSVSAPNHWALVATNTVQVYPQPTDAVKPVLLFDYLLEPTIPQLPADQITFPDAFVELVGMYAQHILLRSHAADLASSDAVLQQFQLLVHLYRTKEGSLNVGSMQP